MINKLKVVNSYGEELTMTLREPQLSGYAITDISGIGPTDVDIKQTQFVSGRKYKYNAGFHKYREIGLSIIYYEWNDLMMTVEQLRNNLYKYFKTNDKIKISFEKDDNQYSIEGYISKHEPTFFSNNCGVRITILCPDPWFRKLDINYYDEALSNSINTTEDDPGTWVNYCDIIYEGDISNGLKLITNIESGITEYKGRTLTLISKHESSGIQRQFVVNVPGNCEDSGQLIIDLLSDIINVYTVEDTSEPKFCNGWIDATTISKRQELPEIMPGNNNIKFLTDQNEEIQFKILYNTLYRGL